jgi:hypothetical protein
MLATAQTFERFVGSLEFESLIDDRAHGGSERRRQIGDRARPR